MIDTFYFYTVLVFYTFACIWLGYELGVKDTKKKLLPKLNRLKSQLNSSYYETVVKGFEQ